MNLFNPFLSICIPTYNRSKKVYELVKNILNHQEEDIEIVILDNHSTDDTISLLGTIKDSRLKVISNAINIGGIFNVLKVITEAKGVYSLLCLDKDFINYEEISNFIYYLKDDDDIAFGYCSLDLKQEDNNQIFKKGFSSVLNMAYLSKHPSGYFYKTETYKNSRTLKQIFTHNLKFEFNFELINAEISFTGKSKIINLPLIFTEDKIESANNPSFTYNKNNLYFAPSGRINEYKVYMSSVCELDLLEKERIKLFGLLYYKGLNASTFVYRSILSDYSICKHHGIETRKVGLKELIKIDWKFSSFFFKESLPIPLFRKILIYTYTHLRIAFSLVKNTIRKMIK